MRKTIAAVTVGLLLVAGQAAAANEFATARVGDRVGARADAASGFQGEEGAGLFGGVNPFVLVAGIVAVGVGISQISKSDPCESDC